MISHTAVLMHAEPGPDCYFRQLFQTRKLKDKGCEEQILARGGRDGINLDRVTLYLCINQLEVSEQKPWQPR